jgi:hypothetical protein
MDVRQSMTTHHAARQTTKRTCLRFKILKLCGVILEYGTKVKTVVLELAHNVEHVIWNEEARTSEPQRLRCKRPQVVNGDAAYR